MCIRDSLYGAASGKYIKRLYKFNSLVNVVHTSANGIISEYSQVDIGVPTTTHYITKWGTGKMIDRWIDEDATVETRNLTFPEPFIATPTHFMGSGISHDRTTSKVSITTTGGQFRTSSGSLGGYYAGAVAWQIEGRWK